MIISRRASAKDVTRRKQRPLGPGLALLAALSLLTGAAKGQEDPYEKRITDDFIENTTFRFRTKFPRLFIDTQLGEFKTIVSHRIDVPPLIDGVLEDDCWKMADHTKSAFSVARTKTVARKQTVVYACHDGQNLYMAFVNEEPNLRGLVMKRQHPVGRRSWTTAGRGDCIEAFIELGGVGGTGQVFQFIFNIHPQVAYDGLFPPSVAFIGTGYRLKGSIGAKRWTCEIAFPYRGFNTDNTNLVDYRYPGPPRRGEVWGLRVIREGPKFGTQGERFVTTWTYNRTISNHIPFPTGIIVFEDRNALLNAQMNEVDPETNRPLHWRLTKLGAHPEGSLFFDEREGHAILKVNAREADEGLLASQQIGTLPGVGFKFKMRLKKIEGDGDLVVGVDRPALAQTIEKTDEWETHVLDFFSEAGQREATVYVRASGGTVVAAIGELSVEQQIYGAPQNAVCLTGNSPRVDLNLKEESLAKVKYTYRKPGTDQERFPFRKQWSPGWTNGEADPGGSSGWIPATKGSLTHPDLQQTPVEWTHPRPSGGSISLYPDGHEVLFDLGREFYIRCVELLPIAGIGNMTARVRAEGSDRFILSRKLRGAGVLNPPGAVLFGRLNEINSVGRYLKLWFGPMGKIGQGMYFVRVWGEEKGDRTGIRRFRWKDGLVVPEQKYKQFRKLREPVLMPTPQEVEWGEGGFAVSDGMPIYYRREGRGEPAAQCLMEQVESTYGIRLRLVAETGRESVADGRGAIVLGEVNAGGLAVKLAKERGWKINAERPGSQGYFLSARPDGVLICGFDQAGTFYGVQTLLQLLIRQDFQTAAAKAVEIRDWPYIPWRMISVRSPGSPTPGFIRALARLKINVIASNRGSGRVARMCDDYFMFAPSGGAGHSAGSPIEMNDDENWYHLGMGAAGYFRMNACPSHRQRYEFYEGAARGATRGSVQDINIGTDEMDGGGGAGSSAARWLGDRRCLDREMTGDELFTEMVIRAYDLFRLHHVKTAIMDTMLVSEMEGGNGDYYDMYKAYDQIPEDLHIYSWRGFPGHAESNPEEAVRRFERVTLLQASFPFQRRGRLNEAYGAPPGKRVWGVWSTVWGIAGPVDQILAGQFCRSMRSVDGGAIIPFMCQAWNPDSPPVHTLEWALRIGNVQQRIGELALERELPSWRDGVAKEVFKVDIRDACNWSHIDPVPGDDKDWLDWGPNNDLRHLPRGDVQLEEVPFHVIDPKTNGGKSVLMVAEQPRNPRLKFPGRSPEIPVGRQAASLIFLRMNVGGGHLPGYRIVYEGAGPQGRGGFLTVPLDAMGNCSASYSGYGVGYAPGKPSGAGDRPDVHFRSAKHRMTELFSLFFRPAWLGVTGCGDAVKVTMHEWVNPYPELTIKSVSVRCPPGRKSGRIEVLFAITGIAPVERDLALWKDRDRLPLVPLNEVEIELSDTPVFPKDGKWAEEGTKAEGPKKAPKTWFDAEGNEVCQVTGFFGREKGINNFGFFKRRDNCWLANGGVIKLAHAQVCKKIALRGIFYWEHRSRKVHYGLTRFRRTDYVVEVSADGTTWQQVGAKKAICGEDGAHVHPLPATPIQYIRVRLNGKPYITPRTAGYSSGPGLSWVQLYK